MDVNGGGGEAVGRAERFERLNQAVRAHSTATVLFHAVLSERFGMSATDGKTLDLVARLGPLTASQLGAHTGLAPASVTELIDRLEARGLVSRERDTGDRRRVLVAVVPERLAEYSRVFGYVGRAANAMWSEFSDAELEVIERFLLRTVQFVRDTTDALRAGADHES